MKRWSECYILVAKDMTLDDIDKLIEDGSTEDGKPWSERLDARKDLESLNRTKLCLELSGYNVPMKIVKVTVKLEEV